VCAGNRGGAEEAELIVWPQKRLMLKSSANPKAGKPPGLKLHQYAHRSRSGAEEVAHPVNDFALLEYL
jgi:hypothetical protein